MTKCRPIYSVIGLCSGKGLYHEPPRKVIELGSHQRPINVGFKTSIAAVAIKSHTKEHLSPTRAHFGRQETRYMFSKCPLVRLEAFDTNPNPGVLSSRLAGSSWYESRVHTTG